MSSRFSPWHLALLPLLAGCVLHVTPDARPEAHPHPAAVSEKECRRLLRPVLGNPAPLARAAEVSLSYLRRRPPADALSLPDSSVTVAALRSTLKRLRTTLDMPESRRATHLCRAARLVRMRSAASILVTGYYRPVLHARRHRGAHFRYPLYGPPHSPVTLTRAQIDAGALQGQAPVLAWLADPVELFFLHVQGSGVLVFPGGRRMAVGYAASNGRPYTSIGKLMGRRGLLAKGEASAEGIKRVLRRHPRQRDAILHTNERYIFFRRHAGPVAGNLGVPLVPGHSVAADQGLYPAAAAALLRLAPAGKHDPARPLHRLVFVHDTGAAIRGPARLDLYTGTGVEAGRIAGGLHRRAEFYLLLPPKPGRRRAARSPETPRETGEGIRSGPGPGSLLE